MSDFPPVRPFGEWPPIEPQAVDTRDATVIPDESITTEKVAELSVTKLTGIGIRVYNAAAANSIANASDTTVNFDTVDFAKGFVSPTGTFTTVTIPYNGVYAVTAVIEWANGDMNRSTWLYVNSAKQEGDTRTAGNSTSADVSGVSLAQRQTISATRAYTAGDTIGVRVNQNVSGGGALSISTGSANCSLTAVFLFAI